MKYLLLIALALHISWAQTSDTVLVTKYGAACEGGTISLQCPPGEVIHIERAFYGRTDAVTCVGSAMSDQNCVSQSSQYIVSYACNNKRTCSVFASYEVFGDPCPGTNKYMEISYTCVPSDIETVISCKGEPIYLSCPNGRVLQIVQANYGRTDGVTCPYGPMSNKLCHSSRSTEGVSNLCNCKYTCTVSPNLFGDPCFGTHKYLDIQYHCVPRCNCRALAACPTCTVTVPKDDDDDCGCN